LKDGEIKSRAGLMMEAMRFFQEKVSKMDDILLYMALVHRPELQTNRDQAAREERAAGTIE